MRSAVALALTLVTACHPARPTVTGAELYAQVQGIQQTGQATIGDIAIRKGQWLTTGSQVFSIEQLVENCRGGDPVRDVDCTLTLLFSQRFTVRDTMPVAREVKPEGEDQSGSAVTAIVVVTLAVGAAGGLVYGISTCEFPGCEVVFGAPLVLIGVAALFALASH